MSQSLPQESDLSLKGDILEIRTTAKLKWLSWIPLIFNGTLCLIMLAVVVSAIFIPAARLFAPFALIFLFIGYKSFFNAGWSNYGHEQIEIKDDLLKYKRIWWLFKRRRKYEMQKIDQLSLVENKIHIENTPEGFEGIHIKFRYGKRKQLMGKNLSQKDGQWLHTYLSNAINS
jgi:hypothetical protein